MDQYNSRQNLEILKEKNFELQNQLIDLYERYKIEKKNSKILQEGHIKLEKLAKKLEIHAIKEKERADRLELELINRSKQDVKEEKETWLAVETELRERIELQKVEFSKEKSALVKRVEILLMKYSDMKKKLNDVPDVGRMEKKIQIYENGLK